ncbi:MAG: aspartate--ammonia ligase [Bacillota bacterium]|nr:MAG: aspartate--ammonia ligase [Bacillota bacterium]
MKGYKSLLTLVETEVAIKFVKDTFERELAKALDLTRVSAPLFVLPETGLNDNLNGYERTVKFEIKAAGKEAEIVQSLAKWKRAALKKYNFAAETGLYTDMNAIRRDEDIDYIHSVYVDQWDWERILKREERNETYLKETVRKIYGAFKITARMVAEKYPVLKRDMPEEIFFVTARELEKLYPELTRKEREDKIAREKKAVFLIGIGWDLADGKPHDGRAADYDDWNLNGDILLYNELYDKAFEVSSMGIRVDENSLKAQLEKRGETYKLENPFCKGVTSGELPLTVGGGIGQSRLCMYFLKKAHIGEVQASVWTEEETAKCAAAGIELL